MKGPYISVSCEDDLLRAAYASSPWILRLLQISLPRFLVPRELRQQYRDFVARLTPGELVLPFQFNQMSLAMRKGFVVVKDRRPLRVWITELS